MYIYNLLAFFSVKDPLRIETFRIKRLCVINRLRLVEALIMIALNEGKFVHIIKVPINISQLF